MRWLQSQWVADCSTHAPWKHDRHWLRVKFAAQSVIVWSSVASIWSAVTKSDNTELFASRCSNSIYTGSQKAPAFTVSVTLSNLNRFSKFLHCWKAYEICYKTHTTIPTSPYAYWYSTIFCKFSADMEKCKKLHFQCTDFNSSACITVCAKCIMCVYHNLCPRR